MYNEGVAQVRSEDSGSQRQAQAPTSWVGCLDTKKDGYAKVRCGNTACKNMQKDATYVFKASEILPGDVL